LRLADFVLFGAVPKVIVVSRFQIVCSDCGVGKITGRNIRSACGIFIFRTPPTVRVYKSDIRQGGVPERIKANARDIIGDGDTRQSASH